MTVEFDLTPIGKPRMTRSDKWRNDPTHPDPRRRQRPAVSQYYRFKDELTLKANLLKFELPDAFEVEFYVPMPASWSAKKRSHMNGRPHQQKPDSDNMVKALMDSLLKDDAAVWSLSVRKFWSDTGRIVITV